LPRSCSPARSRKPGRCPPGRPVAGELRRTPGERSRGGSDHWPPINPVTETVAIPTRPKDKTTSLPQPEAGPARAEELRAQAEKLTPEMERHQVPVEYLANPELSQAVQEARNAKTPKAVTAADASHHCSGRIPRRQSWISNGRRSPPPRPAERPRTPRTQGRSASRDPPDAADRRRTPDGETGFPATCPIPEVARLGWTLKQWKTAILAYFDTNGASNGRTTEAINGVPETTRTIACGFHNFINYRSRCLLAAGGNRPYRIKQTNMPKCEGPFYGRTRHRLLAGQWHMR
jgi:hypothetical protein